MNNWHDREYKAKVDSLILSLKVYHNNLIEEGKLAYEAMNETDYEFLASYLLNVLKDIDVEFNNRWFEANQVEEAPF